MPLVNKVVSESESDLIMKYQIFGVCYLLKRWLYTKRIIRLCGIKIGSRDYCYKRYIPNKIRFRDMIVKSKNKTFPETIDIIIPVYNGYQYLDPLFESLLKNSDLPIRLFIIDDASPDERVYPLLQRWAKKFGKNAFLFQNQTNLGFVKTVNFGLKQTTNHVVLVNTDIVVPKNWLSRLMAPIFSNNRVATVTPLSNGGTLYSFPEQYINNPLISNYQDIDNCLAQLKLNKAISQKLQFPTGIGFCLAMNKNAIKHVGFLDEVFGRGYGEENDWCMRAYNMGYFHTVAYNMFVWHNQGGSFDKQDSIDLMRKSSKLLSKRYPDYGKLLLKSSNNPLYQSILYLARLLVFNRYAKKSEIIFDSDFDTNADITTDGEFKLILSYNKLFNSYVLTQVYKTDIHVLFDKNLNNLLYIIEYMHFDLTTIRNLAGFQDNKKVEVFATKFKE